MKGIPEDTWAALECRVVGIEVGRWLASQGKKTDKLLLKPPGPMVQDGSVPLGCLKSACEPLLTSNKAGLLVSEVLSDAVHRLGHVTVGDQWKNSGLQWSAFVDKEVDEFIRKHKLEYTLHEHQKPQIPVDECLSEEKVQVELDRLIKQRRVTNEDVIDWVDINVGKVNVKKPAFIRALMTSVCSSAITGHSKRWSVETDTIKKCGPLLQRYLSVHDPVLEFQALYALQALVHKLQHPQDVLRIFFETLYDEDIISEDAFNQWITVRTLLSRQANVLPVNL